MFVVDQKVFCFPEIDIQLRHVPEHLSVLGDLNVPLVPNVNRLFRDVLAEELWRISNRYNLLAEDNRQRKLNITELKSSFVDSRRDVIGCLQDKLHSLMIELEKAGINEVDAFLVLKKWLRDLCHIEVSVRDVHVLHSKAHGIVTNLK